MKKRKPHPSWLGLASLLALAPSRADAHPIDTLRSSTEVYFSDGWGLHEGRYVVMGDETVMKAAGTLNVSLPFSSLGLDAPGSLHLTGSRHGDEVWWDFDQPLSVSIDKFNWTRHIEGRLVARVEEMGADTRLTCAGGPCPYSLFIDAIDTGSWVRLHGTTSPFWEWSELAELGFELFSGPRRPRLSSLQISRAGGVCERDAQRRMTAELVLDDPAPPGGAAVDLVSSDAGVRVPSRLRIPAGRIRGTFTLELPSGHPGDAELTAAAGGIQLTESLAGNEYVLCLPFNLAVGVDYDDYGGFMGGLGLQHELEDLEAELDCRGCFEDLMLGDQGSALATMYGETYIREPGGSFINAMDFFGEEVGTAVLGPRGDVAMELLDSGDTVVMPRLDLDEEPVFVSDFEPRSVDARGVLFGAWTGQGEAMPAYVAADQLFVPDLAVWNGALEGSPRPGLGIGTVDYGNGPMSYLTDGKMRWFPEVAEGATIVDVNAAGDLVGTRLTSSGPIAFFAPFDGGQVVEIPGFNGLGTVAAGLDEAGNVLVNVTGDPEEPAEAVLLWSVATGPVHFNDVFIDAPLVYEVLHVNDAFDLSVRGMLDGELATFALRNRGAWGGDF